MAQPHPIDTYFVVFVALIGGYVLGVSSMKREAAKKIKAVDPFDLGPCPNAPIKSA